MTDASESSRNDTASTMFCDVPGRGFQGLWWIVLALTLASGCFTDPGRNDTTGETTAAESTLTETTGPDPTTTSTTATTVETTTDPTSESDTATDTSGPMCDDDDCDDDGVPDLEELIDGVDCKRSNPTTPDSDGDGLSDLLDPRPRDPYPPFLLYRNEVGTIDLMLQTTDGTFNAPVEIGTVYGGSGNENYRYTFMIVSDFDNDGKLDFLALGDPDPDVPMDNELWFFTRTGNDTFGQQLIDTAFSSLPSTVIDVDGDGYPELTTLEKTPSSGYIETGSIYTYLNHGNAATATCGVTEDSTNPEECLFVRSLGVDITAWVEGQWVLAFSRYAHDSNRDGLPDLLISRTSNGGNANSPIAAIPGYGDGTFDVPGATIIDHNEGLDATPARALGLGDFNGDSFLDIYAGLDEDDGDVGTLWLYLGGPDPDFGTSWTSPPTEILDVGTGGNASALAPGDYNTDGNLDLLVGYSLNAAGTAPTRTDLFLGNGDGTFQDAQLVRTFQDSLLGLRFFAPIDGCVPAI